MDQKDMKIFQHLMDHGRDKISDISKALDIPRVTVYERIQGMVREGIIKKFTIVPDYRAIGLPTVGFIFVSFKSDSKITQRQLAQTLARFQEVEEIYIIAGAWDILLKVRAPSVEDIGNFVLDKLRNIPGVEKTETVTVFSVVK
ncbi:MAG TPA: Lrp/AsnC family transcriptional regulator [Thermoplasmataceae archaeon]|nr:Lrp/AsnC family transcriptional regulator [Thermoplasmatales archaeon AK]HLH85545.1 Lrp/AsnC family transcriptional regulator [Thermoplasmataceae archaeon]